MALCKYCRDKPCSLYRHCKNKLGIELLIFVNLFTDTLVELYDFLVSTTWSP